MFSHHNLEIQSIRGQGYDGASNMRGEWNGLQTLISNDCPYGVVGVSTVTRPFPSLERLSFDSMPHWKEWSILVGADAFSRLRNLSLYSCLELTGALPAHMSSLVELRIEDCPKLTPFPPFGISPKLQDLVIDGFENFEPFLTLEGRGLQNLRSLRSLEIGYSRDTVCYPQGGLPAPNLTELMVHNCENLKSLSERMNTDLKSLRSLSIDACPEIKSFPKGGLPPSLRDLTISGCARLTALPERMRFLSSLQSLSVCSIKIRYFQRRCLPSNLRSLQILRCDKLKELPEGMHTLSSLQELRIGGCPKIESFPQGGLPCNLYYLTIKSCPKLVTHRKEWDIRRLEYLEDFKIGLDDMPESFPDEGLLPSTLTSLYFLHLSKLKLSGGP